MLNKGPKGFPKFKSFWHKDLMAGFVVSLIALPLGLSLAVASGVPPMAGIISCVIGGISLALLGGSYVTVAGPGNGLVVVILSAVVSLGAGDLYQGYTFTLAAVVISGLLIALLGYLKLGSLANFFPTATIQGLLAAIGFILIAKQAHVMLGESGVEAANNLFLLVKIPQSFWAVINSPSFPYSATIGIFSLLLMWAYPKIPYRYLHLIPAPMWIVLLSIGFYYYFIYDTSLAFPIPPNQLIQLPENLRDGFVLPDFGKIGETAFLKAVLGITLIASIESLLSIKAVDKLDPFKRRSNVNKDLKALGIATTISGAIGGLPSVAVIARSSVNVNQGAVYRTANLFHALWVALMVLLFSQMLTKIPLSALAGILVYTGYRLSSPSVFKRMWKAGKDQFVIFLFTLLATLLFGLVNGVLIGIVITFFTQFIIMKGRRDFLIHPARPNTLMYQEVDGKLYLNVKGHATFLNYLSLKRQLDSVPPHSHLILDLSHTRFVDNTVMEHIHQYQQDFKQYDSVLEVVGLDIHDATSAHPFAARKVLKLKKFMQQKGILTYRQQLLKEFSKEIGWNFKTNSKKEVPELKSFPFFQFKKIHHAYNTFSGKYLDIKLKVMDVEYFEGELSVEEKHKQTMMLLDWPTNLPAFRLDKERLLDRITGLGGLQDINIEGHMDFSRRFSLRGEDEARIRTLFTDELILFFESNPYYHLECTGKQLLIVKGLRLATISEVKALANFGKGLIKVLKTIKFS